jgi:magnesium-transporting ATPase (P-type)
MQTVAATRAAAPPAESKLHTLDLGELARKLNTSITLPNPQGLSRDDAAKRLLQHGQNRLPVVRPAPLWVLYVRKFAEPFIVLLSLAGALAVLGWGVDPGASEGNLYLGVALFVIAVLNASLAFMLEYQNAKVVVRLTGMLPLYSVVVREGKSRRVPACELVPGDVVLLKSGDRSPAVVRLIESHGLKIDASSITGESRAYVVDAKPSQAPLLEARNVAFCSTTCIEGHATGTVMHTGSKTLIAELARLSSVPLKPTSLRKEMQRLVLFICLLGTSMAALCFIAGVSQQPQSAFGIFILAFIGIFIANIPQGLQFALTSALTVAAKRMATRGICVKRLDLLETLGYASCICTDKTGTLTLNKLTAKSLFFNGACFSSNLQPEAMSAVMSQAASRPSPDSLSRTKESMFVHWNCMAWFARVQDARGGDVWRPSALDAAQLVDALTLERMRGFGVIGADLSTCTLLGPVPTAEPSQVQGAEDTEHSASAPPPASAILASSRRSLGSRRSLRAPTSLAGMDPAITTAPQASERTLLLPWFACPFEPLLLVMVVCNQAQLSTASPDKTYSSSPPAAFAGAPLDVALLEYASRVAPPELVRKHHPIILEVPFNSVNKWTLSVVALPFDADPKGECALILLKGAPEVVLGKCSWTLEAGKVLPKHDASEESVAKVIAEFSGQGERVLALAMAAVRRADLLPPVVSAISSGEIKGLTLIGLVSLEDPLRPGVAEAVAQCYRAGVRVLMMTGDHVLTAEAVARKAGIIQGRTRAQVAAQQGASELDIALDDARVTSLVLTGLHLRIMTQQHWDQALAKSEIVFARVSPQQKMEIVSRLQYAGEVVAVTGDGINDGPALSKADVGACACCGDGGSLSRRSRQPSRLTGIAMGGVDGSDVAREAAAVVLIDDDFASIVSAILEGRLLFDNLKNTIAFTLTHLLPEALPVVLALVFGMPLGLSGLQVLSIDCGSDLALALAFSFEPPQPGIMLRPPRDAKRDSLISSRLLSYSYLLAGLVQCAASVGAYLAVFHAHGIDARQLPFSRDLWTPSSPNLTTLSGGLTLSGPEQQQVAFEAASALYITIVLSQALHVWIVRAHVSSVASCCGDVNLVAALGDVLAVCVCTVFTYLPAVQPYFRSADVGFQYWFFCLLFAAAMLAVTEVFKHRARLRREMDLFVAGSGVLQEGAGNQAAKTWLGRELRRADRRMQDVIVF